MRGRSYLSRAVTRLASDVPLPLHGTPARRPVDALALVCGSERWTWGDLDRRSAQWAVHLIDAGVRPFDFVAFALPNGPELIALTFGIYRAGATPAPLSPRLVEREIADMLALMHPAAFIGDHAGVVGRNLLQPPPDGSTVYPTPPVSEAWKACSSGGSTGRPKVIVDGRLAAFPVGTEFIGIPEEGVVLVPGPLYHNATFSAAIFALWRGSTLVMMPRFDAEEALALIAAERVEWALMVPTMMHRILRLPAALREGYDLTSWSMTVHTAAAIADSTKRGWIDLFGPDHIWEVYGATEGLFRTWIGGRDWLAHPGSVGRSTDGYRLSIRNERGQEVGPDVEGEIFAIPPGGPGSSYRYIGAEPRRGRDGWESVGDVGRLDRDGYLYLADRRADLIISGGVNIWPAEVEGAIHEHPAVGSCAVFGLPDPDLGQKVHAVIETNDESFGLETLRAHLGSRLSPQKIPRSITLTSKSVRDDAGKVRKSAWQTALRGIQHARS